MQSNTVQTLIDYVKDISGQTNIGNAKVIRALNFAVDHYSYIRITANNRFKWDSPNQDDLPRVTTSGSDAKLSLESELIAVQKVEIYLNGQYHELKPVSEKDYDDPLATVFGNGLPTHYDLDSRHIYLYPVPDTTYTYRLTYSRPHPRYSTSNLSQSIGVDPVHEEYIALYAADRVMIGMSDSARVAVRNELTVKEQEIRNLASRQDQDSTRRLKPKINSVFNKRTF